MIGAALCVVLMFTPLAPTQERRPTGDDAAVSTLTELENTWNQAHLRGDAAALAPLFADDLTVTVPGMPVMSKVEALEFLRSGRIKFNRYETSGIRVRTYGDAAVVSGRLQRTRTINGQAVDDDWLFTKTYVRQGGAWRIVAFHASSNN